MLIKRNMLLLHMYYCKNGATKDFQNSEDGVKKQSEVVLKFEDFKTLVCKVALTH